MSDLVASERAVSFGPFRLVPTQRLLLEDDNPVRVGSRALDILTALVERPGELVGKEELMARVWRGTFVEEGNLKFQVGALRRALGDGRGGRRYIATSAGQGYRFVAPVSVAQAPAAASLPAAPTRQNHNLPARLTRLIGRADAVRRIAALIERHRLLTIVGPGGIGKTSVALAAAETLINTYEHGAWLIDLALLADPRLVPSALATVLGFDIRSDDPVPGLVGALRDRRLLLVLDNCGHVIEAAAGLAVSVLKGTAGVHILATSREPLRVEAEHVQRLPPLSSGFPSDHLGAAEALAFPAVELFVERTAECLGEFELTDPDAPIVAEICRKLDGIPLAIELAAARVETFGVRGLATHLDDRFRLLTSGRRSGPPRHRTLRAALDWSYDVLSEAQRAVLRRLGIFMGGFTLDAACAVVADPGLRKGDVIDAVAELVEKSLAVVETTETEPRLRLLETTRAYALERLAESGERAAVARRHAEYYRELLETAPTGAAVGNFAVGFPAEIVNIRAALAWAFSGDGDPRTAVTLAAASAQLWLEMSLLAECHDWTSKALALLTIEDKGTRREMVLEAAFGISLRFTTGITEEAYGWLTRALELAEQFNDADYKLRLFHVLCTYHAWRGDLRAALAIARRCEAFAAGAIHPSAQPTADRMLGIVQFFLGDLAGARAHLERALDRFPPASRRHDLLRFGVDQRLTALSHKSDILWLLGLADQALQLARTSLAEARTLGHPVSLCNALVRLAAISIRVGDIETSARWIEELHDQAVQHSLNSYNPAAVGLSGQLSAKRSDATTAVRLLHAALGKSPRGSYTYYALCTVFAADLALAEAKAGHVDRGLPAIDEALQRIERNEELWYLPEALRIKGELVLLQGAPGAASAAEHHFRQALDWACRQGALSWELRAATSLARLLRDRDRIGEARDLLAPIYERFTEGFGTADLHAGKKLLDELNSQHRQ